MRIGIHGNEKSDRGCQDSRTEGKAIKAKGMILNVYPCGVTKFK